MAKQPLLDLDTLVERAVIRIDGQAYEMLNPAELSILDLQRFGVAGLQLAQMKGLGLSDTMSDDDMKAISETLRHMTRIVLRAPADVLDRLTDVHRFRIVNAFNELTLSTQPAAAVSESGSAEAGQKTENPPTSAK